jgi:hypothetical protein
MRRVYFVDLDGVLVHQGTHSLIDGALDHLLKIHESGGIIYYFSCWAFTEVDMEFLQSLVPFEGIIKKPLADEYVYIDDKLKLDLSSTGLAHNNWKV